MAAERTPTLRWREVERPPMDVVGPSIRTDNAAEADPELAKIPGLWDDVRSRDLAAEVSGTTDPGTLLAVLYAYESDYRGAYSEIVGVQVAGLTEVPEGLDGIAVPGGAYAEIEIEGPLPYALIAAWQQVWEAEDAGRLERAYEFDYEVHRDAGATLYLSLVAGA